jgi:rhomboid protease GluP
MDAGPDIARIKRDICVSNLYPRITNSLSHNLAANHLALHHLIDRTVSEHNTTPANPEPQTVDLRPRFMLRRTPPYVTRFLLAANVVIFLAMIVYGYVNFGTLNGSEHPLVLLRFGAKVNELVATGELWRLFTAMFLHIGVIHLLFNLYALNALGPTVESYFGHFRYAAIYLIGGLFGSLASYAFSPAPAAGASGAIFGLAGAIIVYFLKYRENFGARGRAILNNMFLLIAINLVFGFVQPGIDNWGHMGGLVGGALVTAGLLPQYQRPSVITYGTNIVEEEDRLLLNVGWILVCLALWYYGVQWATERFLSQS